jgi:hypothetical protein
LFDVIVIVSECSHGSLLRSHSRPLCILHRTDIAAGISRGVADHDFPSGQEKACTLPETLSSSCHCHCHCQLPFCRNDDDDDDDDHDHDHDETVEDVMAGNVHSGTAKMKTHVEDDDDEDDEEEEAEENVNVVGYVLNGVVKLKTYVKDGDDDTSYYI